MIGQITPQQYDKLKMILNGSDIKKRDILLNAAENYKKFGKYEDVRCFDQNLIYSMKNV